MPHPRTTGSSSHGTKKKVLSLTGSGSLIQMLLILFSLSRFHKEDSELRVCTKGVYWGLSLGYCISYFLCCDKLPRPKLLTTEFIWAYSSRESVHNGREGMETDGRSRKLRDHTFNSKHKAEREQGMGQDYNPIKFALSEGLPSERLLPKRSTTSDSVINRGPRIPIPK